MFKRNWHDIFVCNCLHECDCDKYASSSLHKDSLLNIVNSCPTVIDSTHMFEERNKQLKEFGNMFCLFSLFGYFTIVHIK